MLDLSKIAGQIPSIGKHMHQEAIASREKLELVQKLQQQAVRRITQLIENQTEFRDRLIFAAATPTEPLDRCYDIPPAP